MQWDSRVSSTKLIIRLQVGQVNEIGMGAEQQGISLHVWRNAMVGPGNDGGIARMAGVLG
jgi:hypothetical protein